MIASRRKRDEYIRQHQQNKGAEGKSSFAISIPFCGTTGGLFPRYPSSSTKEWLMI